MDRPGEKHTEPGSLGCVLSLLRPPGWSLQVVGPQGARWSLERRAGGGAVVQGERAAGVKMGRGDKLFKR